MSDSTPRSVSRFSNLVVLCAGIKRYSSAKVEGSKSSKTLSRRLVRPELPSRGYWGIAQSIRKKLSWRSSRCRSRRSRRPRSRSGIPPSAASGPCSCAALRNLNPAAASPSPGMWRAFKPPVGRICRTEQKYRRRGLQLRGDDLYFHPLAHDFLSAMAEDPHEGTSFTSSPHEQTSPALRLRSGRRTILSPTELKVGAFRDPASSARRC